MPASAKPIKKNIAPGIKKNLLLANCLHFQPAMDEAKMLLEFFYFESYNLKYETIELPAILPTPQNFFQKASSIDHATNK